MTLTRNQRKAMRKSGKILASLNRQLSSGRLSRSQYSRVLRLRNELSQQISGSGTIIVSGGLPSLGKRR